MFLFLASLHLVRRRLCYRSFGLQDVEVVGNPSIAGADTKSMAATEDESVLRRTPKETSFGCHRSSTGRHGGNEKKRPTKPMGKEPLPAVPAVVVTNVPFSARFVKEEVLGKGSFGTVYRAKDGATGSMVAVKEIRTPKQSKEAKNEAAMLQKLQGSPTVVTLYGFYDDCGESDDADYKTSRIVMSLCGGGDIAKFVQKYGPLNDEQLRVVAVEVARLAQDCHAAGILHSDIKASNLMLSTKASQELLKTSPNMLQPGWLVVSDMGTARVAGMGFSSKPLGTPTHWAPEVFGRRYTYPADLWSDGTMLFHLRYGRMHFWDADMVIYTECRLVVRETFFQESREFGVIESESV